MQTRLNLRPGSRGTKKLLAQYGKQLVCIRYRYDEQKRMRYKTIELILEAVPWQPKPPKPGTMVQVKITFSEDALRKRVKSAGGRWDDKLRVWRLPYGKIVELGLRKRIVGRNCV